MRRLLLAIPVLMAALFAGCSEDKRQESRTPAATAEAVKATPVFEYTVVRRYPHDVNAFTEGLLFHNGRLIESTGSPDNLPETKSLIGTVDLQTGRIDVKAELDRKTYFGEGIAVHDNKLYQLTWQNQTGFIYDASTFARLGQFHYPNREGWGFTTDGTHLIMSDGTFNLTFLEPGTMRVVKTMPVRREGFGVDHINELEWVKGYIYANIWMTNKVVKIDPSNGNVVAECDMTPLYNEAAKQHARLSEMNGIAYNPETGTLLVTGKLWPLYFELKVNESM